jgi:dTMP kinase
VAFFERVIAGYAAREAADRRRFERIDARAEPAAVWQQVEAALARRFG